MAKGSALNDTDTLQMALVGYQIEKDKIEEKIRSIQAQLKEQRTPASSNSAPASPKRILSAAARRRIARAQKKRWAEHRKRAKMAAKQGA